MTTQTRARWATSSEAIRKLETAGIAMACLCVLSTMLVVAGDTFMRYVLNSPWSWALDVTSAYLLVGAAYLGISATFTMGDHINIDLLQRRLPPRIRLFVDIVFAVVFVLVFGTIGYLALNESITAAIGRTYIPGYIPWPVWLSFIPIPIGVLILCIRLAHHFLVLLTEGSDPFISSSHVEESAE